MNEFLSLDTVKKLAERKKAISFINKHKSEIKYAEELLKILGYRKEIKIWKE